MTSIALKKCANGGLKLKTSGRLDTCCDFCEIAISLERERIMAIPPTAFKEYGEGLLIIYDWDTETESRVFVHDAFEYQYRRDGYDEPFYAFEYFRCSDCEKIVLYNGQEYVLSSYRITFWPILNACRGCIVKYLDPTLLAVVDASGPSDTNIGHFVARKVWSYTNNNAFPQIVYYVGGGNVPPTNQFVDNWAQLLTDGKTPQDEGLNIDRVEVFPNQTVDLYNINESNHPGYNPWEIHAKVYAIDVTCDPCEVKLYEAMQKKSATGSIVRKYGAGYYTGNGQHKPCKAAFLVDRYDWFYLYVQDCETCDVAYIWDESENPNPPYIEDATACDGEGEVQ